MTEQYTQVVEVKTQNADKIKLILGILLCMLSLVFFVVAILKNRLFFIGFGVLLALGFVFIQLFESAPSVFIYSISPKSLVISKKNNAHNTKRVVCISLENIVRFEAFSDILDNKDIVACESVSNSGVYSIVYKDKMKDDFGEIEKYSRLLFSPDDYLLALLQENFPLDVQGE